MDELSNNLRAIGLIKAADTVDGEAERNVLHSRLEAVGQFQATGSPIVNPHLVGGARIRLFGGATGTEDDKTRIGSVAVQVD